MFKGFRDFIMRGNVVDLAVAVAIGAAFNSIVNALVKDIITPLASIAGGRPDFSGLKWTIGHSTLFVGDVLNSALSFFITASVIYFFVILPMNAINKRLMKNEPKTATTKTCPECLSTIPLDAHRCKYCTSKLSEK